MVTIRDADSQQASKVMQELKVLMDAGVKMMAISAKMPTAVLTTTMAITRCGSSTNGMRTLLSKALEVAEHLDISEADMEEEELARLKALAEV